MNYADYSYSSPKSPEKLEKEKPVYFAKLRQLVSPIDLVGVSLALVLLLSSLMVQIEYYELNAVCEALETELADLETDYARILVDIELSYDLESIETYAKYELGMQKPNVKQIIYIEADTCDKAVVVG